MWPYHTRRWGWREIKPEYPNKKVAEFVIEKLDVTSLPFALRPKKEKGKKTFADYGFTAQTLNENEAVVKAASGVRTLAIKVLDQKSSKIYVCVVEPGENGGQAKTQSVVLLKRKDSNALLKGTSFSIARMKPPTAPHEIFT